MPLTTEIEVSPSTLKVLFLELQDREILIKHIIEEIQDLNANLAEQQSVVREIREDLKAHLGIKL